MFGAAVVPASVNVELLRRAVADRRLEGKGKLLRRGRRLAVYLAERNAELESVEDLSALVSFTRGLARALTIDEGSGGPE